MSRRPDIAVFDTETTGLTLHPDADPTKQPRCIEFGGVILSGETGEVKAERNWLIDPGEDITEEITKITGITTDQVRGQPSFQQRLPDIIEFFLMAGAVMAHNLPFDKAIIHGEFFRIFPGAPRDQSPIWWPKRGLCTVGVYKESWGRNPRLIELYPAVLGKPLEQTHRALDDVKALVEIIQAERLWELV